MSWVHIIGLILFWFAIGLLIFGEIALIWGEITNVKRNGDHSLDDFHGGDL